MTDDLASGFRDANTYSVRKMGELKSSGHENIAFRVIYNELEIPPR